MRTSRLKSPLLAALFGVLGASLLVHSLSVHPQDKSDTPSATQSKESASGASGGASTKESDTSGGTSTLSSGASAGKLDRADERTIRQLAESNLAEINAGKLAQDKAQSDEVKSFAKKMVDDHTKALDELKQLAQSKGVTLPTEPNRQQMAMEQKLQGLSGDKFDRQYMKEAGEKAHKQTQQLLQKAAKADDTDLKNYANKTMAAVEGHQQMVKETERSLKATASGKSGQGKTKSGEAGEKSSGSSGADSSGEGASSTGTSGGAESSSGASSSGKASPGSPDADMPYGGASGGGR